MFCCFIVKYCRLRFCGLRQRKISRFSYGTLLRNVKHVFFITLLIYCFIVQKFYIIFRFYAVNVLQSICQQIWKTQQWPQNWKRSVFILIPKKGNPKECSIYRTIALISHASKVMLKILRARLQQYVNRELPDVQAGFRKDRGTRDQIANICWIIEKAREFQRNVYFCFIDYTKAFDCVDHNKLWKILKEMGIPDHLTFLLKNLYAGQEATFRTGHGPTDWF